MTEQEIDWWNDLQDYIDSNSRIIVDAYGREYQIVSYTNLDKYIQEQFIKNCPNPTD